MTRAGKAVGVFLGGVVGVSAWATPPAPVGPAGYTPLQPPPAIGSAQMPGPMATPMTAGPMRVALSDVVSADYRDAVLAVVRKPTISTRSTSDEVVCDPAQFDWLLAHPDRVALAWQRLKVPCTDITDIGNGQFAWTDPDGSVVVWQAVGKFPDGVVWYATGKVKPGTVGPTVPVKAVVVVSYTRRQAANGGTAITPTAQGYMQTDSRAAAAVMRMLGPTTPKLAEQSAEQMLFFFSGIARYVTVHPEKAEELLAPAKK